MISHMHEAEASGLCSPDAPPIFEVAHKLIRDVVDDLSERHTEDEIRTSAEIIQESRMRSARTSSTSRRRRCAG
jgi:hypothetical protein